MFTQNLQFRKYTHVARICLLLNLIANLVGCAGSAVIYTSSPNTYIEQGLKAESLGHTDNAIRAYTEAAKLSGRGNMYLGNLAYQQKDFATAERQYRLALRDIPDNAALYNNLAWSLLKQKHKLDEAEEFAMLAVQRSDEKTLVLTWETLNTIRQIRNKPISPMPPKRLLLQSKKKLQEKVVPKKITSATMSPKKTVPAKVSPKKIVPKKSPDTVQDALKTMQKTPNAVQDALKKMQEPPVAVQDALDELGTQFIQVKP